MSEPKYAYRIPPCSKYDIAGMESWLEDMAAKGLYLDRDGLFLGFATFVQDEPDNIRFRLTATDTTGGLFSPTHDPEEEALAMYQMMGWHYRGRWGQFHIYATDDPDAPELHTDPRVQALTIQALNKFQRTELWGIFLYTAMMYFFHGSLLFSLTAIWGLGKTLLLLGFLLSFPMVKLIGLVRMMRLKRQLKKGIPMSHRSDWSKGKWSVYGGRLVRWTVGFVLFFSLMGLFSESILEEQAVNLEDWYEPLPFATVQELYPEGTISQREFFINNQLTYWSNWISPHNYDFTEWREITLPDGTKTNAYLRIWYYDTRFDWFASMLARELANQNAGSVYDRLFTDSTAPEELESIDADYAVFFYHHNPGIALQDGSTVIIVRYSREVSQFYSPEEVAQVYLDSIR